MPDEPVAGAQDEKPAEIPPGWFARFPLSRVQSIIAIGAGLVTIVWTVGSLVGLTAYRQVVHGDVTAIVSNARSRAPIADATIEILTPKAVVITTLTADADGRVKHQLREGEYRLRVTHPQYLPDQKDVQVWAGQSAEVRVALTSRPAPKAAAPAKATVKGFLEKLGF
jgi:hypothetical protein